MLKHIRNILRCPACKASELRLEGDFMLCRNCGKDFPVIGGKPVLHGDRAVKTVESVQSHQVPWYVAETVRNLEGRALNIGSGNSSKVSGDVVHADYLLYDNTDLAADAQNLPFKDASFDFVFSLNVFEHLRAPEKAAAEIRRVLRPGGRVFIHTAFLQPLHSEPSHYFNVTEFGLREWFREFSIEEVAVSDNFSPVLALSWIANTICSGLESLPRGEADLIRKATVGELADFWSNVSSGKIDIWNHPLLKVSKGIPDEIRRRACGGFELRARKSSPTESGA